MKRAMLLGCVALTLACGATAAKGAQDVVFTFTGQITANQYPEQTAFQVGDSFVVYLDYTPTGSTPALGYLLTADSTPISATSAHTTIWNNHTTHSLNGLGPPYFDNYFANFTDPLGYDMYCSASATLSDSVLSYCMTDESFGPQGSVSVGSGFPSSWMSDMSQPLPGNVSSLSFTATGTMAFCYVGTTNDLTGSITGGTLSLVPEPAALGLMVLGTSGLLRRPRIRRR